MANVVEGKPARRENAKSQYLKTLKEFLDTPYGKTIIIGTSSKNKFNANKERFSGPDTPQTKVEGLNPENYGFEEPIDDVIRTAVQKALAVIKILTEVTPQHTFIFNFHTLDFVAKKSEELLERFEPQIEGDPYTVVTVDSATSRAYFLSDFGVDISKMSKNVLRVLREIFKTERYPKKLENKLKKNPVKDFHNLARKRGKKAKKLGRSLNQEEVLELLGKDKKKTTIDFSEPVWIRFVVGKTLLTPDLNYANTAGLEFFVRFKALPEEIIDEAYSNSESIWKIGPRVNLAALVSNHPELVEGILYRNHEDDDSKLRILPRKRYNMVTAFVMDGVPPYELSCQLLETNKNVGRLAISRKRMNI